MQFRMRFYLFDYFLFLLTTDVLEM